MQFEFATATRIIFGKGEIGNAGVLAASMGRRALITAGRDQSRAELLVGVLKESGVQTTYFAVSGEPTTTLVRQGVELARQEGCDLVIGFGGGSAIDAGKAIAILLTNEGDVYDYLEVIGKGKSFGRPSAPFVAIPTTAGTGSEVTRNAVLSAVDFGVKVSLRSSWMLPQLALIDPSLTYSLQPDITAFTGLDALTQLIEPYLTKNPNPLTDTICREGMQRAARSLLNAYNNGKDEAAREDMSIAALFSGLALANAKLGAVHGFAGVLGGSLNAPHGAICARLLPVVMSINARALSERAPQSEAFARCDEVAQILTGKANARAADGIAWLYDLVAGLGTAPLSSFGLRRNDFPGIVQKSAKASSMKGNPVQLTQEEMSEILELSL